MNVRVEEFLKKKQLETATELIRRKNLHLLELGLYDVEYAPDNCFSENYPDIEDGRYCKKKPIEVTQEEYESICQVAPIASPKGWPIWPVDKLLFVLSIVIYGVGFIVGIVSGTKVAGYNESGTYYTFVWIYALTYWFTAYIFGSILLGFSEHLRLLDKISKNNISKA